MVSSPDINIADTIDEYIAYIGAYVPISYRKALSIRTYRTTSVEKERRCLHVPLVEETSISNGVEEKLTYLRSR